MNKLSVTGRFDGYMALDDRIWKRTLKMEIKLSASGRYNCRYCFDNGRGWKDDDFAWMGCGFNKAQIYLRDTADLECEIRVTPIEDAKED